MQWRLILDEDLPGAVNMARDSFLLGSLESGEGAPTLRLYGWDRPTISLGYLQDESPFAGLGLPVVRRITGGRAVLHWHEVTYSVAGLCGDPLFSGGILKSYSVISRCITAALRDAGVEAALFKGSASGAKNRACFQSPSRFEVLAGGRKIVGSAQRRFRKAFLQHGSILMGPDTELNDMVFGPGIAGKMASAGEFSTVSASELRSLLVKRFAEGFGVTFDLSGLTREDEAQAL
ncbi:MAG: hypothetical protein A2V21_302770 [Deltaproteobacteria bacterium GWC2_55_46]|nr:MAG: hypothetical protein A2V21_302770 [Deltaproteobacteria bacterium GWC2_55_46]